MLTILDFEPNDYERAQLGIDEDTDDELRAMSEGTQIINISSLLGMRGDAAGAKAWLEKLPADDPDRIAMETMREEWSILPHTPSPGVKTAGAPRSV